MTGPSPVDSSTTFRSVLGVGVVVLLVLLALGGLKGYRDLGYAHRREAELSEDLSRKRERIERLEARIEDLKSDPSTLEALAREELMMMKPGDVVIVLDSSVREAPARPTPVVPPASP